LLLFVSPFFFPEPISTGKYNADVAKGLRDAGFSVTAIASEPLYPDWTPRPSNCVLPGVEIIRGGAWVRYPQFSVLRRLVLELWYLCFVAYELPRHMATIKGVVAVFPPVLFLPFSKWILHKDTPIIGIVHDLQSIFVEKSPSGFRRIFGGIVKNLEGAALNRCERLIFLSQSMMTRAIKEYRLDAQRCVVHLPFVSVSSTGGSGQALADRFMSGARHVVYSGALGEKQNPEQLIECFIGLAKEREDVVCHCFSRGPVFDELKRQYQGVRGVEYHDLVDERDLPELFNRSDIQIVPQLFGTSEAALPSKLPNLIAAGVPVLAICDEASEAGRIVLDAQAGAVVHSWAPEVVSAAVMNLLDGTSGHSRQERKTKAAEFVARHFSLQKLVDDIAAFVRREGT
jgi:glycosyltransferase involved in cell wall biosynthesis